MALRNFDANFVNSWGVSIELFVFIVLFWLIFFLIFFGQYSMNYGIAGPITVLVVMGNCLFIKFFGWQALVIPAGIVILFFGFLMLRRR